MSVFEVIIYTFNKFIDLIFNRIQIEEGVSLGYVILFCAIFVILVKVLLNLPNSKGSDNSE